MSSAPLAPFTDLAGPGMSRGGGSAAPVAIVVAAAIFSAALLLWAVGDRLFAAAFAAGLIGAGAIVLLRSRSTPAADAREPVIRTDMALLRAALDAAGGAVAVTDEEGRLRCANGLYSEWFGSHAAPAAVPFDEEAVNRLKQAASAARRDGAAQVEGLGFKGMSLRVDIRRAGVGEAHLLLSLIHI